MEDCKEKNGIVGCDERKVRSVRKVLAYTVLRVEYLERRNNEVTNMLTEGGVHIGHPCFIFCVLLERILSAEYIQSDRLWGFSSIFLLYML